MKTEGIGLGVVVIGAIFVDIKGYPSEVYIPGGRNAGGWSRCMAA